MRTMDGDRTPMPNFSSPSLDQCSGLQWKFPPSYEWLDVTLESDFGRLTRKGKFLQNFASPFPNWKLHSNDKKKSRGNRGFVTQRYFNVTLLKGQFDKRYFLEESRKEKGQFD